MPLANQPILIVDSRNERLVAKIGCALAHAGADCMVASDSATAMKHLQHFEFTACIVGAVDDPEAAIIVLLRELGGMPVLRIADFTQLTSDVDEAASLLVQNLDALTTDRDAEKRRSLAGALSVNTRKHA